MFEELVWPIVHNPSDKCLHTTEVRPESEDQHHREEDGAPRKGAGYGADEVWEDDEAEVAPILEVFYGGLLNVSQVT